MEGVFLWEHGGRERSRRTAVLLVEDDPNVANLVDRYLRRGG